MDGQSKDAGAVNASPPEAEAACIAAACAAALTIVSDEEGPFSTVPGYQLRRMISAAVTQQARNGVRSVDDLKFRALHDLIPTLVDQKRWAQARRLTR